MNMCVFMGRLAKDPEYRVVQTQKQGLKVAGFPLVVKRNRSSKVFVIRVTAYGANADFVKNFLTKGTKVMINGEIVTNSFQDQESGKMIYFTELIMDQIEFGESKATSEERKQRRDGFRPMPEGMSPFDVPDYLDEELPFR